MPRSEFTVFLEHRPRVALVILRIVASRLRYAGAQQAQFGTHDALGRLAHRLLELSERFGVAHEGGIDIELPLSQEELASWIGASREAVSKAFQTLRSLGIVETGRRQVTILDRRRSRTARAEPCAEVHPRTAQKCVEREVGPTIRSWRPVRPNTCTKDAPCTPSPPFPRAVSAERPSPARSLAPWSCRRSAARDRASSPTSSLAGTTSPRAGVSTSSLAGTTSAPSQDLRSADNRDPLMRQGTLGAPDVTVVKLPQPAQTPGNRPARPRHRRGHHARPRRALVRGRGGRRAAPAERDAAGRRLNLRGRGAGTAGPAALLPL